MRWQPALRVAAPYYDDPVYVGALARSVRAGLASLDFEPEVVLASYHGIPQAYSDQGDPYFIIAPKRRGSCARRWGSARSASR